MGFDMNYKIKVANEVESKEAQELFFELGCSWLSGGITPMNLNSLYLYTGEAFGLWCGDFHSTFNESGRKEITLPELRDLVVLKRNDVGDATHEDKDDHRFKYRLINNHWHVITDENPAWRKDSIDLNDAPLFMKPIEKKEMKEYLIKINGAYKLCNLLEDDVTDEYIEIPEGDTWAYKNSRGNIITMHGEVCQAFIGDLVWKRESPNDKLASAEQYRQAEVLPFIDDDFAESDAFIESNIEQDNVNNPSHYADSAIECIDAMQAMLTPEQFVGYLRGNILKYQWRYEKKNGIEDLRKSQWYLDKLISVL